jgi:hypothetical protein
MPSDSAAAPRRPRRQTRYPLGETFWCCPFRGRGHYWWLVYGVNRTAAGVILYLSRPLPHGSLLTLKVANQAGSRDPVLRGLVTFVRKRRAGGWKVGCAFVKPFRGGAA